MEQQNKRAKRFFQSIRNSYKELECLKEQRNKLFSMLTSTSIKPKEVDVMTSGSGDKMSEVVPVMLELDEKINTQVGVIIKKQLEAENIIQQIDNMKYRETLRWYYVQNLRWDEVAKRMNYDISYIQRVNGQALAEAEKYCLEVK
ncbi:MAG: DUF1492 domain-containing protein [Lachnospiraceae bacterium]|nr:DUF1492 domain-containing protein [Lachnospiraceae bacterium]